MQEMTTKEYLEHRSKVKPISPDAVASRRENNLPQIAITTINEMIQANFKGRGASLKTKDIFDRVGPSLDESHGFMLSWPDVVDAYSRAGWSVLHFEDSLIFTQG